MSTIFSSQLIGKDTWRIQGEGADCYLLRGKGRGILIDSGMSAADIRSYAEAVAGVPVPAVINTHSHFDHTAGNGFFDTVYGTGGIARSAKNTMGADPAMYRLNYAFTLVEDGDILDIGGRKLMVILLDAHAPGNIALLDTGARLLFPGDEIETGQVLLLPGYAEQPGQLHARPAATVEGYLRAMEKLFGHADAFDQICPAHNGSPIGKEFLYKYIALARHILDGHPGKAELSSPSYGADAAHHPLSGAHYLRAELGGASLIYCADRVSDATAVPQPEPATRLHEIAAGCVRQ